MPIEIIARRNGFRRCGMVHSSTPTVHPDSTFTAEELAQLKAEPQLIVTDLAADGTERGESAPPSAKTKAKPKAKPKEAAAQVDVLPSLKEGDSL